MPLPLYDTADAVPQDQRDDYVEHEGKWHPKAVVELATERKKRATLLDEKKESERLRKEAEKERDDLKLAKDAKDKGISEEELQKIRDKEAEARKPLEDKVAALEKENRKLTLTDRVQALYLAHGGMSDRVEDAMLVLDRRTDLGDAGGIVFKDKDGTVSADDAKAFFGKLKTDKPWLFQGSGGGGGGGGGGGNDAPPAKPAVKVLDEKRSQVAGAF